MTKTPRELADERILLSAEFGRLSDEFANLLEKQARYFNANRPVHNSDKSVERAFDGTEEGIKLLKIRPRLKALEKQMSSITQMLNVLNGEARNQW